jgi:hypothetical protein
MNIIAPTMHVSTANIGADPATDSSMNKHNTSQMTASSKMILKTIIKHPYIRPWKSSPVVAVHNICTQNQRKYITQSTTFARSPGETNLDGFVAFTKDSVRS